MCRDKGEGGRRCPHDSSDKRHRRRISTATASAVGVDSLRTTASQTPAAAFTVDEQRLHAETRVAIAEAQSLQGLVARARGLGDLTRGMAYEDAVAERDKLVRDWQAHYPEAQSDSLNLEKMEGAYEVKVREVGANVSLIAQSRGIPQSETEHSAEVASRLAGDEDVQRAEEARSALAEAQQQHTEVMAQVAPGSYQDYDGPLPLAAWRLKRMAERRQEDGMSMSELRDTISYDLQEWKAREVAAGQPDEGSEAYQQARAASVSYLAAIHATSEAEKGERRAELETRKEVLEEAGVGYRQILREVSPHSFGGSSLQLGSDSDPEAAAAIHEASDIFPTHWIDGANERNQKRGSELVAQQVSTETRAFYQDTSVDETVDPIHEYAHTQPGVKVGFDATGRLRSDTPKPEGEGWEPASHNIVSFNPTTHQMERVAISTWRKPRPEPIPASPVRALVTVSGRKGGTGKHFSDKFSVAAHESTHLMEHSHPEKLILAERAFFRRRTEGQQATLIYPEGSQDPRFGEEMGVEDSFISHYAGKTYRGENAYEILTLGVEGVFAGRYGGLIGADGWRPDKEHKDLVLGVFAVG